jgi:hypothetical protein
MSLHALIGGNSFQLTGNLPEGRRFLIRAAAWLAAREGRMASQIDREPHPKSSRLRRIIEGLGPYQSLVLLAIPTALVEPLKLIAVAVAGDGHWITGTVMIVAAYAASFVLVERLFLIVKPKLLMLPWFARLWTRFIVIRGKAAGLFRWA